MGKFDKIALGSFKDDIYSSMVVMGKSLEQADNKLQTIENFVDKYVPLTLHTYILEFLEKVFTPDSEDRKRLDVVSREKFSRIHDMILADTGHSHLEDAIEKLHREMLRIMK
jgi:BMFP domain-containing protein YqiC